MDLVNRDHLNRKGIDQAPKRESFHLITIPSFVDATSVALDFID